MKILEGRDGLGFLPLDGNGSDIPDGVLLTPGVTAGTDLGVFIISGAAGDDVIAVKEGIHDFSEVGDSAPEDVVTHVLGRVNFLYPGTILAAEYDQSDTETADGGSSGTTLTVTSLEDNIDSSWIYVVSGDAIGQLHYVDSSASGSCTFGSTPTTDLGTADTFIKILRRGHALIKLNTARAQIGTDAAAGSGQFRVLVNQYQAKGTNGWEDLDPTKHDGLTGLNTRFPRFRSLMVPENSWFTPND